MLPQPMTSSTLRASPVSHVVSSAFRAWKDSNHLALHTARQALRQAVPCPQQLAAMTPWALAERSKSDERNVAFSKSFLHSPRRSHTFPPPPSTAQTALSGTVSDSSPRPVPARAVDLKERSRSSRSDWVTTTVRTWPSSLFSTSVEPSGAFSGGELGHWGRLR